MVNDDIEMYVCADCIMFIANGDMMGDEDWHRRVIQYAEYWHSVNRFLAIGAADAEIYFSFMPCDLCDSSLGGSRHQAWALSTELASGEGSSASQQD
jgi:hypothetical protein